MYYFAQVRRLSSYNRNSEDISVDNVSFNNTYPSHNTLSYKTSSPANNDPLSLTIHLGYSEMHRKLMDAEKQRVQDVWALLKVTSSTLHSITYPHIRHSLYYPLVPLIIQPFVSHYHKLFLHLFIHSFIHVFIHSIIYSFFIPFLSPLGTKHPHTIRRNHFFRCGGVCHV